MEKENQSITPQKPPEEKKKKFNVFPFIILTAIIIGIYYGFNKYQRVIYYEETDNAYVTSHIYPISSKIAGSVSSVLINDNQHVKKGDNLVFLDKIDYEFGVEKAKIAYEIAKKQTLVSKQSISLSKKNYSALLSQANGNIQLSQTGVDVALASVKETEKGLSASIAQVEQVNANIEKAKNDYMRYKDLLKSGSTSVQQLEGAKVTYESLLAQKKQLEELVNQNKARLVSAKENVQKAKAQVTSSRTSIDQADANSYQINVNQSQYDMLMSSVKQSETVYKEALNQLSYTTIKATADGVIGKKTVEEGQRLQAGQLLMSIVGDEKWIIANFKETQMERIQKGQEVEIKVDAFPKNIFKGKVDSISLGTGSTFALLPPDNATGNFTKIVQRIPVKIVFDKDSIKGFENKISAGMSCLISIKVK